MPKPAHLFTYQGYTDTLTGWACRTGLPRQTLKNRLQQGWTFEQTVTTPLRLKRSSEEIIEAVSKRCSACRQTKPLTDFHRSKSRSDGYKGECKECRNATNRLYARSPDRIAQQNERYARQRLIIDTAKSQPCTDCQQSYPGPVMHFHHRDPTLKIKEVAKMVGHTEQALRDEIAKCDVVCANCHIIRHLGI